MGSPRCSLIVAVSENGVIGRQGTLPWRLSADLRRFRRITMGHHLVMGRKTYESIGRPLPGRTSIVVTRQADYRAPGCLIASSLAAALDAAAQDDEVFIVGGAEIYRAALPRADRLYLTRVHAHVDGETRFPELDLDQWQLVSDERQPADAANEYAASFQIYDRRAAGGRASDSPLRP